MPETTDPIKIMSIHVKDTVKDKNEWDAETLQTKWECAVLWLPLEK